MHQNCYTVHMFPSCYILHKAAYYGYAREIIKVEWMGHKKVHAVSQKHQSTYVHERGTISYNVCETERDSVKVYLDGKSYPSIPPTCTSHLLVLCP